MEKHSLVITTKLHLRNLNMSYFVLEQQLLQKLYLNEGTLRDSTVLLWTIYNAAMVSGYVSDLPIQLVIFYFIWAAMTISNAIPIGFLLRQ